MEFGFAIPNGGVMANRDDVVAISKAGEAAGFDILSSPDHIVMPRTVAPLYPYSKSGDASFATMADGNFLEPFALMAFVAAHTERVKLMTSVIVLPYREPVLTAKLASTIDELSGGRFILGSGAGWMEEEFVAVGAPPFAERGKITDEYIDIFRELWTKERPTFNGDYSSFDDFMFAPKPKQSPLPIWIGGESRPAMRRVARRADGWFPSDANPKRAFDTPARFGTAIEELNGMAAEEGRDPASIHLAFWAISCAGACDPVVLDSGERKAFTGTADDLISDIKAFQALGVQTLMFNFLQDSRTETLEKMDAFVSDIMPHVR